MRRRQVDAILELFDGRPPPPWAWALVGRALLSHVGVHRKARRRLSALLARLRAPAARRWPAQATSDASGREADSEGEPSASVTPIFVWSYVDRVIEAIVSLAFTVLVVRQLGPAGYSAFAALLSVIGVALVLSSLGSAEVLASGVPALARSGSASASAALIQHVLIARIAVLTLVAATMYGLGAPLAAILNAPELTATGVWIPLLLAMGVGELLLTSAAAYLSPRRMAAARLAGGLAQLVGAFLLFSIIGVRFTVALLATTISWLTIAGVLLAFDRRPISGWYPPGPLRPGTARQALFAWMASLVTAAAFPAFTTLGLGVLGLGRSALGFYFAASVIATRLLSLATLALGPITVSMAVRARDQADTRAVRRVWLHAQCVYLAVLLPVLGLAAINAEPIVRTLMAEPFLAATPLLRVALLFSLVAGAIGNVPSYWVLIGSGRSGLSLLAMTGSAVVNGVVLVLMVPRVGAMGAVIANGCAQVGAGVLLTGATVALLGRLDFPWRLLALLTVALVAAAIVPALARQGSLTAVTLSLASWFAVMSVGATLTRPLPAGVFTASDRGLFGRALRRIEQRRATVHRPATSPDAVAGGAR